MWVTCVSNTWSSTSFSITVLQLWTTITSLNTFFEFCSERVNAHGAVFGTRAFGDAVFAGNAAAVELAASEGAELPGPLDAPFAQTDAPYEALSSR